MVTAYATMVGGFLLLSGRLADRFGRRRLLQSGLVIFAIASMVSGLAQNGATLITARAFQGLGASLITPAALSILTTTLAEGKERNKALGVWGSLTGIASIIGVVGWVTARTVGSLAGVAVLFGSFVLVEMRSTSPLIPVRIFRLKTMRTANIAAVLVFGTISAMFFFVSLFMQQVYGYSPMKAGVAYVPLAVCVALGAGVASGMIAKVAARRLLIVGLLLTVAGLFLFGRAPVGGSYLTDLLPEFLFVGIGCGICYVTLQIAAFVGVRGEEAGVGAGLINTSQEAGGALGLAIISTIAYSGLAANIGRSHGATQAIRYAQASADHHAFIAAAFFGLAATVVVAVLMPRPSKVNVPTDSVEVTTQAMHDGPPERALASPSGVRANQAGS